MLGLDINLAAIAPMSALPSGSGYRLMPHAASAITSVTEGSGPYGYSFEDSLYRSDCPATASGILPG